MTGIFKSNLLAAAILILGFCRAVSAAPAANAPDWVQLTDTTVDFLYVKPDADLSVFDRVIIDPLSVWHAGSALSTQASDLERLRIEYAEHFETTMIEQGYEIVSRPSAKTLRLHVEIIDLKVTKPSVPIAALTDQFRFNVERGKITLVAELQNAKTGEVLLRLADLENNSGEAGSLWDEVTLALRDWSRTLGATMNQLGRPAHDRRLAKLR